MTVHIFRPNFLSVKWFKVCFSSESNSFTDQITKRVSQTYLKTKPIYCQRLCWEAQRFTDINKYRTQAEKYL